MIDFKPLTLSQKQEYDALLAMGNKEGCEYSFVNLYLWGRQKAAKVGQDLVIFSQYNRKSVYLFPVGPEDKKKPSMPSFVMPPSGVCPAGWRA